MPIDARIPLGVTGPDPNSFTNALGAGMKLRELQNASERLAAKDEAATAKTNALRKFYMSDRGPEAVRTLGIEAPDAVSGIEKNTREAELADIQRKKHQIEFAKANHQLLADATGAILANPTRENALAVIESVEAQGGDMSVPRKQLGSTPDQALIPLFKGWVGNAQKVQQMALADQKANAPVWDSYNNQWINRPAPPGQPTAPSAGAGPEAPPGSGSVAPDPAVRPGTVVPGGELPPPEDIEAERLYRAGQGPAPTGNVDFEGLSDAGLDELVATSTSQNGQKPGAPPPGPSMASTPPPAAPVPSAPPVDGQPPPVPPQIPAGGFRSRAEAEAYNAQRQAANDQRQAVKDAEANRIANERLEIERRRVENQEAAGRQKREIASGQRLTPADASKVQQKLVRLEVMKQQIAAARSAWEGLKGTYSAGPGAGLYTYTPEGEKFEKIIAGLGASKTALLRTPGIGAMSDREQALDIADLPSRSTYEGTTEQQIAAYEALVKEMEEGYRGLLAGPAEAAAPAGPDAAASPAPAKVEVSADKEPPMPKLVKVEFDGMPMPGEYAGKRIKAPDGTVYRSNGRQWVRE